MRWCRQALNSTTIHGSSLSGPSSSLRKLRSDVLPMPQGACRWTRKAARSCRRMSRMRAARTRAIPSRPSSSTVAGLSACVGTDSSGLAGVRARPGSRSSQSARPRSVRSSSTGSWQLGDERVLEVELAVLAAQRRVEEAEAQDDGARVQLRLRGLGEERADLAEPLVHVARVDRGQAHGRERAQAPAGVVGVDLAQDDGQAEGADDLRAALEDAAARLRDRRRERRQRRPGLLTAQLRDDPVEAAALARLDLEHAEARVLRARPEELRLRPVLQLRAAEQDDRGLGAGDRLAELRGRAVAGEHRPCRAAGGRTRPAEAVRPAPARGRGRPGRRR